MSRRWLCLVLNEACAPAQIVRATLFLYEDLRSLFVFGGDVVAKVAMRCGVRQGCLLSGARLEYGGHGRRGGRVPGRRGSCVLRGCGGRVAANLLAAGAAAGRGCTRGRRRGRSRRPGERRWLRARPRPPMASTLGGSRSLCRLSRLCMCLRPLPAGAEGDAAGGHQDAEGDGVLRYATQDGFGLAPAIAHARVASLTTPLAHAWRARPPACAPAQLHLSPFFSHAPSFWGFSFRRRPTWAESHTCRGTGTCTRARSCTTFRL